MRIIALKTLHDFYTRHSDVEQSLRAWYHETKGESWKLPRDIKNKYHNASIVANNRVVFNIQGNKYRLVVAVRYDLQIVYIRFVGTHNDYDKIDATNI
ncbi:MAG: type II toxin-antitoxin system HigB family toxin [Candidatus Falkowbacteria bacterium]